MRELAAGGRTVPVHHAGGDFHHVAGAQLADRSALFLIQSPAGSAKQNLTARMRMPAVAHAGSESHVADRAVHRVGRRDEHFEPGIAREIRVVLQQRTFGKNILRQLRLRCFGR